MTRALPFDFSLTWTFQNNLTNNVAGFPPPRAQVLAVFLSLTADRREYVVGESADDYATVAFGSSICFLEQATGCDVGLMTPGRRCCFEILH